MTEKRSESDKPWRFKKGQSGNPGGRPKTDPETKEILRAATPDAARRLIQLMRSADEMVSQRACDSILDRAGYPKGVEVAGKDGERLVIEVVTIKTETGNV